MYTKRIRSRILVAASLLGLALLAGFFTTQYGLSSSVGTAYSRENLLRLHIIPHSNAPGDQDLKLRVRNAVLKAAHEVFSGVATRDQAISLITDNWEEIQRIALGTVQEQGFDYPISLELGTFKFPDKTYGELTVPAGDYEALRIVIGEGNGKNWWCVLFPPLCLSALDDQDERGELVAMASSVDEGKIEFRVKFWDEISHTYYGKRIRELWQASLTTANSFALPLFRGK